MVVPLSMVGLDFMSSRTRKPISPYLVMDVMFVMSENWKKEFYEVMVSMTLFHQIIRN